MRIYITHCSAKKDSALKGSGRRVTPDKLYTATPTRRFIEKCKRGKVNWAIFSDQFGIWFPQVEHEWYEKDPNTVTQGEFKRLVNNFEVQLKAFDEIWFYYNPGRFHLLYRRLLNETALREKVSRFTHLNDIV
jgi:hypothetical protein